MVDEVVDEEGVQVDVVEEEVLVNVLINEEDVVVMLDVVVELRDGQTLVTYD